MDRRAAQDLIAFYLDAGCDAAIDETAHDRFAEAVAERVVAQERREARLPERQAPAPVLANPTLAASAGSQAESAGELARAAGSLAELKAALEAFEGCALKTTAKQLVFADGNPEARLMFVGEAPGAEEDRAGLPFVGRSGQLLDRMIQAIGLSRAEDVYIANIVPWRPPGNRTPTPQETATCLPFLKRQIALSGARIVVCLGGPSMAGLLEVKEGIMRMRGRWFDYAEAGRPIRVMPVLHPAYLLRNPQAKRLAWRDFLAIKAALDAL